MAIYCMQCGASLPDDAMFCLKCGKPVGSAAKPTLQQEPKWEYCEIVYEVVAKMGIFHDEEIRFWAKVIGSEGVFSAGDSPIVEGRNLRQHPMSRTALDALIQKLSKNGWEPLPNGGAEWYSYKFRRKVR